MRFHQTAGRARGRWAPAVELMSALDTELPIRGDKYRSSSGVNVDPQQALVNKFYFRVGTLVGRGVRALNVA